MQLRRDCCCCYHSRYQQNYRPIAFSFPPSHVSSLSFFRPKKRSTHTRIVSPSFLPPKTIASGPTQKKRPRTLLPSNTATSTTPTRSMISLLHSPTPRQGPPPPLLLPH